MSILVHMLEGTSSEGKCFFSCRVGVVSKTVAELAEVGAGPIALARIREDPKMLFEVTCAKCRLFHLRASPELRSRIAILGLERALQLAHPRYDVANLQTLAVDLRAACVGGWSLK